MAAADSEHGRGAVKDAPWYMRVKTLVITAGALAVAILSVLQLARELTPGPDPITVARIESIEQLHESRLSDFESEDLGEDVYLPTPELAGTPGSSSQLVVHIPDHTAPTQGPLEKAPRPKPTTPTPTETTTPTPTETSIPTPTPTTTTARPKKFVRPSDEFVEAVATQPVLGGFNRDLSDLLSYMGSLLEDDNGDPITPAQAADNLVAALADVELEDSSTGTDALGWTLLVKLHVRGLPDEPLLLKWSLVGPDVPERWHVENVYYRIIATSDEDRGTVRIWVPNLKGPGQYKVEVVLNREDGSNADTVPFELPAG